VGLQVQQARRIIVSDDGIQNIKVKHTYDVM